LTRLPAREVEEGPVTAIFSHICSHFPAERWRGYWQSTDRWGLPAGWVLNYHLMVFLELSTGCMTWRSYAQSLWRVEMRA